MCERSVGILSGTSIPVMSHCDIHHECVRREPIVFSTWKDDKIWGFTLCQKRGKLGDDFIAVDKKKGESQGKNVTIELCCTVSR